MTSLHYVDGGDLNSHPHVCVTNVSFAEPSPQTKDSFKGEFVYMSGLLL